MGLRYCYWLLFQCMGYSILAQLATPNLTSLLTKHNLSNPKRELLISFEINKVYHESTNQNLPIKISWQESPSGSEVLIKNISKDTITLSNLLPFGKRQDQVYITGIGDHPLSRTYLFTPGYAPVNIILPDNAWNLGYASKELSKDFSVYALVKRKSWDLALRRRFETILYPEGSVVYELYIDTFSGEWQNGLRACFQDKKLYDLKTFNDSMYRRSDLEWIKSTKMIHLIMGWDQRLFDRKQNKYVLNEFIQKGIHWYGGDDAIGIWPTWPALGIDQRNQWDMFRDMPGGINALKELSGLCHKHGIKFFICYNPWDESTRKEGHLNGMATLVKMIDADGVVLDTRGSSSKELQAAVDRVRPGVVMYSEGMAVPKDMESILAGRVHNALYYPPILNLNKLIQPDFAIFRVTEVYKEPIRREIHTALFNGYGIEFNLFHPGNPEGLEDQYKYLGRCLKILREHQSTFNDKNWTPLYPGHQDSILINHWSSTNKDLFTIYNPMSSGFSGSLFQFKGKPGRWIDLWHHKKMEVEDLKDTYSISLNIDPYPVSDYNTNNEGSMGVVARFDPKLNLQMNDVGKVAVSASSGTHIFIWAGAPSYQKKPIRIDIASAQINLSRLFPGHEGDYVFQVFDSLELIDEDIISISSSTPRKVSVLEKSNLHEIGLEMVEIPADTFTYYTAQGEEFIPYPITDQGKLYPMQSFYMDRHPVTNKEFERFLIQSRYKPKKPINFLKHWNQGKIPTGMQDHPVVYVSVEDVQAYCRWAGKRLPTELEWQYAAQTSKNHTWPWGHSSGIQTKGTEYITETLKLYGHTAFDSTLANPGNGKLDPVNTYKKGINPYGLTDLVGSVWQLTSDCYQTGSYVYYILKGGSYYKPTSSWWYVQGGPQPLNWRQMLLLIDPGFERKSTVGFRCVRDK